MARDHVQIDPTSSTSLADSTGDAELYRAELYRYEPSGIGERSGHIPTWLKLVVLGLIIWGLYYGIRYWNSY